MTNSKKSLLRVKLARKLFNSVTQELAIIPSMDNDRDKLNALYNAYKRLQLAKGVFRGKSIDLVKERLKYLKVTLDGILLQQRYSRAEEFLAEGIYNEARGYKQKLIEMLYSDEYQQKEKGVTPNNQPQNGPTERS